MGIPGVWFAMAFLDWGFRALCFGVRWRQRKWKTKRIGK